MHYPAPRLQTSLPGEEFTHGCMAIQNKGKDRYKQRADEEVIRIHLLENHLVLLAVFGNVVVCIKELNQLAVLVKLLNTLPCKYVLLISYIGVLGIIRGGINSHVVKYKTNSTSGHVAKWTNADL